MYNYGLFRGKDTPLFCRRGNLGPERLKLGKSYQPLARQGLESNETRLETSECLYDPWCLKSICTNVSYCATADMQVGLLPQNSDQRAGEFLNHP